MRDYKIDKIDKINPSFDTFSSFCNIKTHKSCIDLILTNKKQSFQLIKTTHVLMLYIDFKTFKDKEFLADVKLKKLSRKSNDSNQN